MAQATESPLTRRLAMHLAFAQGRSEEADACAARLTNGMEDRLSYLSLKVRRGDFEAAAKGYADILADRPEMNALRFYAAVCYSRLELYDASLELTESYLNGHPDSIGAGVLKACNAYKMHGHDVACSLLSSVCESSTWADLNPLARHNRAVFERGRDGHRVPIEYIHFVQHDAASFERPGSPLLRPFQKRRPISHCMTSVKEATQKLSARRENANRNLPSTTSRRWWTYSLSLEMQVMRSTGTVMCLARTGDTVGCSPRRRATVSAARRLFRDRTGHHSRPPMHGLQLYDKRPVRRGHRLPGIHTGLRCRRCGRDFQMERRRLLFQHRQIRRSAGTTRIHTRRRRQVPLQDAGRSASPVSC